MPAPLLSASVGKKLGMAGTGILLYGFLVTHLAGNLLLLKGDGGASFNAYADFLSRQPLLVPAEIVLIAIFAVHLYLAITVTLENRRARPVPYEMTRSVGGRSWASRTMIWTGLAIVVFLVVHIAGFKYGDRGDGSLHDLVVGTLRRELYAGGYVVALAVLGFHLWHAFQSAFQTLGLSSRPKLRKLSMALCLLLAGGFAAIPAVVFLATGAFATR